MCLQELARATREMSNIIDTDVTIKIIDEMLWNSFYKYILVVCTRWHGQNSKIARACTCASLWLAETKVSISFLFLVIILWNFEHRPTLWRSTAWYIRIFMKACACPRAAIWLAETLNGYIYFVFWRNALKFKTLSCIRISYNMI